MLAEIILAMVAVVPTDQTVNVAKGTKLDVNNFAGDVNVKVWDKDAVRVEVNHSDREMVDSDPDLAGLRGDPRFVALAAEVRARRPAST